MPCRPLDRTCFIALHSSEARSACTTHGSPLPRRLHPALRLTHAWRQPDSPTAAQTRSEPVLNQQQRRPLLAPFCCWLSSHVAGTSSYGRAIAAQAGQGRGFGQHRTGADSHQASMLPQIHRTKQVAGAARWLPPYQAIWRTLLGAGLGTLVVPPGKVAAAAAAGPGWATQLDAGWQQAPAG